MWRYIALAASICSPLVAALHAAQYEAWKDWLKATLGLPAFVARLVASVGISAIGIGIVFIVGYLVWRVRVKRKREVEDRERQRIDEKDRGIISRYWNLRKDLMILLQNFRDEINLEMSVCIRFTEKGNEFNPERWDRLKKMFSDIIRATNVFDREANEEKHLQQRQKLGALRELREGIIKGLRRVEVILVGGEKGLNTIFRAEEMVADVGERHLVQFEDCLKGLL